MKIGIKVMEIYVLVFIGALAVFVTTAESSHEFPITTNESAQINPAIFEDIVVWQDDRNGNWDIYGYNLSTQKEFQITTDPHDQQFPAIYGDIAVWEDERNGNCDIYGYNLSTQKEFQITTDPHDQQFPAIYGDIVVWNYHRNIYGYNLKTRKEFQITTGAHKCRNPAISKDIVVWEDSGHDGYFIFGYNLKTHEEFKLTGTLTLFTAFPQHDPALSDNIVVWTERFDDNIYGYNLSTSDTFAVATARMSKCSSGAATPAIHEDIVVWTDCRNGNADIYGFNLTTEQEFLITTNKSCQSSPAIHGDIAVWDDDRNGNYDIYGANISPPLTTTRFNSRIKIIVSNSFLILLVASAIAVPSFLIGRGAWQMKKMKDMSQMLPSSELKDFRRNLMGTYLSSVLLLSYAVFAVYAYLLEMRMLSGFIFFILPVFSVLNYFWSKRIPYLRITNDEIMIFKAMGRKPKVVRRDTIRKINIQTWPDLPYKADLLLSNSKKVEIEFSSVVEEDRKDLIQALREVVG